MFQLTSTRQLIGHSAKVALGPVHVGDLSLEILHMRLDAMRIHSRCLHAI